MFVVRPKIFGGIEFGSIGGKAFENYFSFRRSDVVLKFSGAVRPAPIADKQQFAADLPFQIFAKSDGAFCVDGSIVEAKIILFFRDRTDARKLFPVEGMINNWRFAFFAPRSDHRRALAQTSFVENNNHSFFPPGLFFNAGKR